MKIWVLTCSIVSQSRVRFSKWVVKNADEMDYWRDQGPSRLKCEGCAVAALKNSSETREHIFRKSRFVLPTGAGLIKAITVVRLSIYCVI